MNARDEEVAEKSYDTKIDWVNGEFNRNITGLAKVMVI